MKCRHTYVVVTLANYKRILECTRCGKTMI